MHCGNGRVRIIGRKCATHNRHAFTMPHKDREEIIAPIVESTYIEDKQKKLQEIHLIKATSTSEVTPEQKTQLVTIYNK